jgi:hypothetical protein
MASATLTDCTQLDSTLLERVNYFPRQLLTADDMTADQEYFIAKLRRHNRYLHGWGVVCGLEVSVAPTTQNPWQVRIGPGYALGPYGDEIYVPNPVFLDLAQCAPGAATDPCDPGTLIQASTSKTGGLIYLAIRYEECYSRPVRVMPGGCGCNDSTCEPSRISDSYEIECLADLPASNQPAPQGPSLCDIVNGRVLAQCPPCPSDPWVVLTQIQLPAALGVAIAQGAIDNVTVRRKILSTAMIQEQVRLCCCSGQDRAPVRVTSVNPASGTVFTNASTIPSALVVTFDKHLAPATVNTNTILVVRSTPGVPSKQLAGTVTYDDGAKSTQFLPVEAFTIPGTYLVTVVGSGPSQIVDSDNLALDGNADGQPGGNFLSQFTVATTNPTPTPTPTTTPTPTPTPTQTPTPSPLTGVLKVANAPNIPPRNPAPVGDLVFTISGGVAGQKVQGNVTVILSLPIGATPATDTAQWADAQGNVAAATKAGNTYTFTGVSIVQPGAGASFDIKIGNMKVDASKAAAPAGPFPVTALLAIAGAPFSSITGTTPPPVVARVLPG